ncbi:hypothetical protein GH714_011864 [Hevea brasiliensis]|uniref:NB-ARC domain-containing protein n=1 Tax=Hevea brasiliensis TaxID=3981 RepID=A0A6A6N2X3_HEVBR|nr:hypothetical protein GH714_011864 [Hevea brasiliensis]
MWLAEGFILQSSIGGEETMEDVGEEYLDELVSRCMVQAREENFLGVIQHTEDAAANTSSSTLQLTSSISGVELLFIIAYLEMMQAKSRLPWEIGHLIHLRYLGLYGAGMNDRVKCLFLESSPLPSSIGNLRSLYTLDLRNNYMIILPAALSKLECLRHLLVDRNVSRQVRFDKLRNLESLKMVYAKYLIKTDAVRKLTNLRNLSVYFWTKEEVEVVLRSPIFGLGRLCSLKMRMRMESFPNLEPLSRLHHLTKVELDGAITEDPHSSHHNLEHLPASLAKLTLINSQLKRDPMGILKKLPSLRILELYNNSYIGSKMVCSTHGFPQLETLSVKSLYELEEWEIEEEDWEIKKRELIRMWIAEGFILQSSIGGEETMEDVGEEYLEELVSRCMVQVSKRDHTGTGVKRCRIHDLERDMCISKAREENFLGVIQHTEDAAANTSSSTLQLTLSNKWRRIAIHPRISGNDASKSGFYVPSLKNGDSHLRSLSIVL